MTENQKKILPLLVVGIMGFLLFAGNSDAITSRELNHAIQKASKLTKSADHYQEKLVTLEEKLQEAKNAEGEARRNLEEISQSGKATQVDIQQAEIRLKRTNQKVAKLTKKLEKHRQETKNIKIEADEAVDVAKKLASQREYEVASEKLEEAEKLLEYYELKVKQLESQEREAEAEVLARQQIGSRSESQWDRWLNTWNEKIAKTKSNSIFDELSNYRQKISQTKKEIETAKARLKEVENDDITYNQP